MAGQNILRRNPTSGVQEEIKTPQTAADTPLAGQIPALNTGGKLSTDLLPVTATSAGAGDAGKVPTLDAAGRLDTTMMPVGIGADTATINTSESLSAGDWVNIWNNASAFNVRKADGSAAGKPCHGFVLSAYGSGVPATVYFEGTNTAVTGQTAGPVYLSTTTAGIGQSAVPTGAGKVHQELGVAVSATAVKFEPSDPITLA